MLFKELLAKTDGGDILDVGCGSGQFTEVLTASLRSFDSITGIDVDDESLQEARKKFTGSKYSFVRIEGGTLPYSDESFNTVAISKALHHVEDPGSTLTGMWRVLKPGGVFLINEMHRDGLSPSQESHKLYHHLRSEIDNLLGISHNYTFTRPALVDLFNNLNLEERIISEFNPDQSMALDPGSIEEFVKKMDGWMHQLNGMPEKDVMIERAAGLKERFYKHGISRPPQLVLMGRK